jgi:hypothetical protein
VNYIHEMHDHHRHDIQELHTILDDSFFYKEVLLFDEVTPKVRKKFEFDLSYHVK